MSESDKFLDKNGSDKSSISLKSKDMRSLKFELLDNIKIGFESDILELPFDLIVPLKVVPLSVKSSKKFKQIKSSIKEVGIIEPIIVSKEENGKHILLDGHLRFEVMKQLSKENGTNTVTCLISTDDESFTYNKYVNRLAPIQEQQMILKAIERGVSKEKLSEVLDIDIANIQKRLNMTYGICDEVVELLKDKMVSRSIFTVLKQMKPTRQIEVAQMMVDTHTYSDKYARAFLAATPIEQIVNPKRTKRVKNIDPAKLVHMENELKTLQSDYELIEGNYSTDVLNLTLAKTYLAKLLSSAEIVKYLLNHSPEILTQFQRIADLNSIIPEAKEALKSEDVIQGLLSKRICKI